MLIYNVNTKKKEKYEPINKNEITMYVCGPTLYGNIHIGNARPIVFFDVVYRILQFLDYKVTYASNITDVDDKIINKAIELNLTEEELVEINKKKFNKVLKELNIKNIDYRPQVTKYMEEIINFIQQLIELDYAYKKSNGDVYFRVNKIKEYGKISNRKLEDLITGSRIDIDKNKEYEHDFVLWKNTKTGIIWEAPFGSGRPGWHTECVVMIRSIFGQEIDIHGGGMDLKFPHHENENAQNLGVCNKDLSRIWMHNGFVNIDNEKMSKSLNNFITAQNIIDKYGTNVARLLLLQTNYRQPINLNSEFIENTIKFNDYLNEHLNNISINDNQDNNFFDNPIYQKMIKEIKDICEDDFNTPNLITYLNQHLKKVSKIDNNNKEEKFIFNKITAIICFDLLGLVVEEKKEKYIDNIDEKIKKLIQDRDEAKNNKNYQLADELKELIFLEGYKVIDTREGTKIIKK